MTKKMRALSLLERLRLRLERKRTEDARARLDRLWAEGRRSEWIELLAERQAAVARRDRGPQD